MRKYDGRRGKAQRRVTVAETTPERRINHEKVLGWEMEVKKKKYNSGVWEAKSDSTEWSAWCVPAWEQTRVKEERKVTGSARRRKAQKGLIFAWSPKTTSCLFGMLPTDTVGTHQREIDRERERAEIWLGTSNARNAVDRLPFSWDFVLPEHSLLWSCLPLLEVAIVLTTSILTL